MSEQFRSDIIEAEEAASDKRINGELLMAGGTLCLLGIASGAYVAIQWAINNPEQVHQFFQNFVKTISH